MRSTGGSRGGAPAGARGTECTTYPFTGAGQQAVCLMRWISQMNETHVVPAFTDHSLQNETGARPTGSSGSPLGMKGQHGQRLRVGGNLAFSEQQPCTGLKLCAC